jgi:hypothetical protein
MPEVSQTTELIDLELAIALGCLYVGLYEDIPQQVSRRRAFVAIVLQSCRTYDDLPGQWELSRVRCKKSDSCAEEETIVS